MNGVVSPGQTVPFLKRALAAVFETHAERDYDGALFLSKCLL